MKHIIHGHDCYSCALPELVIKKVFEIVKLIDCQMKVGDIEAFYQFF